jgi:hypothetical protein
MIRDKFEGFEPTPPESVWTRIKEAINPGTPPGSISTIIFTVLAFIGTILTVTSLLINTAAYLPPDNTGLSSNSKQLILSTENTLIAQALPAEVLRTNANVPGMDLQPRPIAYSPAVIVEDEPEERDYITGYTKRRAEKLKTWNRFTDSGNDAGDITKQNRFGLWISSLFSKRGQVSMEGYLPADQLLPRESFTSAGPADYYRIPKGTWKAGVTVAPEIIKYSDRSSRSVSLDFMLSYTLNDFFITTGAGFRNITDKGKYNIEYNQHLGTYDHVYHVSFDSTENGVIPTYHTFEVDVYDTVNHYRIGESKVQYQYFEIPVLFGYRKSFGKVTAFVNAGPSLSFLMNRSIDQGPPDIDQKARILKAEGNIPSRISTNWQLMVGGGVDLALSNRFSLTFEPLFRFYMSPEYQSVDEKPFSFGVRTGIFYQIGK